MHTRKQWKTDFLISIALDGEVKARYAESNHSYLFRAFCHLWKRHMKNWYPSFSIDRGPTWGRNLKSKSVK